MPAQDIRVGAWTLTATTGTTRTIVTTWTEDGAPFPLTGRDVTLQVGDTEIVGVVSENTATFTVSVPEAVRSSLELLLDGELMTVGTFYSDPRGVDRAQLDVAVTVEPIAVAVSVFGVATSAPGSVLSVNGQTGAVVLDAADVGADPSGSASAIGAELDAHEALTTSAHGGIIAALNGATGLWVGTEAEYAAIPVPSPTVVYVTTP